MNLFTDRYEAPLGVILLAWDARGALRALDFSDYEERMKRLLRAHYGDYQLTSASAPETLRAPLTAYFAGDLNELDKIVVQTGGTDFQRQVWAALRAIPVGKTMTYGELAIQLGRANASRAIGLANGSNPVGIVVPCHRVIGASGALTGYAGGIERKRWLLTHEGAIAPALPTLLDRLTATA